MSIIRNHISILYYRIHIYLLRYPFYKERIVWDFFFAMTENYLLHYLIYKWFNLYATFISKRSNKGTEIKELTSQIYYDLCKKHRKWIRCVDFIDQNLAIILIILSIVYDLLLNPYKLIAIFYVLPIAMLYLLFQTLAKFYFGCQLPLDSVIHRFLYKPYIKYPTGIIILEEGGLMEPNIIDGEVYDSLIRYMLNNYRSGPNDTMILEEIHKKYGRPS